MALFPRKINGQFAMLSRQDGVNNYIMLSDSLRFWENANLLQEPIHPLRNLSTTLRHSPLQFTVQDLLSLDWVG